MLEKYNHLFDLYLEICKGMYDPKRPYDNLDKCVRRCQDHREQLIGMVNLIAEMGELTRDEADKEVERVISEFSSMSICHAYVTDGEVMVFQKGES